MNHIVKKLLVTLVTMCTGVFLFAQSSVSGTVKDHNGDPLVGAAVMVTNGTNSTALATAITDVDGKFQIQATEGQSLFVSYIGHRDKTLKVTSSVVYNIVLDSDDLLLDETVVVGYGTQKKVNLTGSVATVDAKALNGKPITQASTALQGMVPGVTVTTASGGPGDDGGTIRVRGINSFGGSSTAPLVLIDGVEGSIDSVDPALIESISVLKDAASSAIYGSRAANGVILVTTKRGNTDKFSLSYSGYVGWQNPTDLPKVVNSLEYRELTNDMNRQDGKEPTYDDETMEKWRENYGSDPDLYPDTDWQKAILSGPSFMHNHSISLGIGTERVKMLTTLGYLDQDGIISNTGLKRYTFRNNTDVQFNEKLSMKMDIAFSNSDRDKSPYSANIFNYMNTRPADITNQFSTGYYNGLGLQGNNPIALMKYGGKNSLNSMNFSGSITLTYKPWKWLSLQGMMAPKFTLSNDHNWKKSVTTYQDKNGEATLTSIPFTTLTESSARSLYGNYNFLVTAHHKFGVHDLKGVVGVERNTYDYKYLSAYREDFNYDYDQIDAGEISNMNNSGHRYQWDILSYFGRINYGFKDRYLLEANIRMDGSSRFTKKNRWGYFPSVSGAWRVSEEPFMAGIKDKLTNLKVRASYGSLGNQNLSGGGAASYYPTTQNLATGQVSMNDNIYPIVTLNTLANPDIKWEKTSMVNVGLDFALFGKLYVSGDWYNKITDGILMKLDMPLGIGLNAPYQNAGKVRNRGWEVSVAYNDQWGDFSFGVQANLSDVRNEILDMKGKTSTSGVLKNQEGHEIASIWTLKSLGIIRTQEEADWVNANCPQFGETVKIGDIRYADIDGNEKIDENDKDFVGSTIPRYTYSTNFNFGWKGLNLSILLQGVGKADGFLNTYYVMPSNMGGTFRKEHLDWASDKNPNGKTPRLTSDCKNNWYDSSFWMKSAAYLRVKNVTLGYSLPSNWMKRCKIQSVYVYASAQNLFTFSNFWDGYDPEVGYNGDSSGSFDVVKLGTASNYPQMTTYTLGLQIKF